MGIRVIQIDISTVKEREDQQTDQKSAIGRAYIYSVAIAVTIAIAITIAIM